MLFKLSRLVTCHISHARLNSRLLYHNAPVAIGKYAMDQIDYIKSVLESDISDWSEIINNILTKQGNINQKNVDGVLLKLMVSNKKFETARSFAFHIKSTTNDLTLGSVNGLLALYYKIGKENNLSNDERQFILDTHRKLYEKYKILDFTTCEHLLHALCTIDECEKALKVLDDIYLTSAPSHSAYSTLIATLFKNNKKKTAMEVIEKSVLYKRPLQDEAYQGWIDYILRKYKDKKVIAKYMGEICSHISRNYAIISINTASKLKDVYGSLGWKAQYTKIRKFDGQCTCCKQTLDCLKLSEEEFHILETNVKDKLIVGSDLFLKTSPDELKKFLNFIEKAAPFDVILDALNIAYSIGKGSSAQKMTALNAVVNYFTERNKKILLLGRKHILNWQKNKGEQITGKTYCFFTDNLSQDDPYFITAAILSGSHTDIVSKDLLRGHMFQLKDEHLRSLFKRWQWQHQWMVFVGANKRFNIQPPLTFTPCAQKKNEGWHLSYKSEDVLLSTTQINDGIPNLSSWLCLEPKHL